MDYALVSYPLSHHYQTQLEIRLGGAPEYLKLTDLRHLSLWQLVYKLRSLKAERIFLPLEDVNSSALLPVLELLAAFSSAKKRFIITPELIQKPMPRYRVFIDPIRILTASFNGWLALKLAQRDAARLLKLPLQPVARQTTKRILYLKTNFWYGVKVGGSVGHIAGVISGFCRQNYHVDFVGGDPPALTAAALTFHRIKPLSSFGMPPELNIYRFSRTFRRQLEKTSIPCPEFIYQRFSLADATGVMVSRKLNVPLVLEYNGSEAWIAQNWGNPLKTYQTALRIEAACLKHAHLIVVVSNVLRDELIARGIEPHRIVSYPNCIDPEIFNPDRFDERHKKMLLDRHGIPDDNLVATFVGTFGEWHGVDVLARAIRELIDEDITWVKKYKLHFLLIGDGYKMAVVRQILAPDRYKPFYTLTGLIPQHEAPGYLAASDILLSPHIKNPDGSRFFGSPTKLYEYMAMGKGMVASDLEQIGETLEPGVQADNLPVTPPLPGGDELAILTKPGDITGLIKGIRFLAENPSWREHLGANARREALAKYTWDHHTSAILAGMELKV